MAFSHPLIPKHKSDVATARLAVQAGYPAVEPVLYDLLEWLQDCNWPVAQELFDFLGSIGAPLAPHIRRILSSDDQQWRYWIVGLLRQSPELYSIFRADVHRMACSPRLPSGTKNWTKDVATSLPTASRGTQVVTAFEGCMEL
ncbi:DUF5071 domain-containing protein [Prosthecobacter sp.]